MRDDQQKTPEPEARGFKFTTTRRPTPVAPGASARTGRRVAARTEIVRQQAVVLIDLGLTAFTKESGRTVLSLCAEASVAAIADAGLEPGDIDGLVTFTMDESPEHELLNTLGLPAVRTALLYR